MSNRNPQSGPNSITPSTTESLSKGKGKERLPEDAVHSSGAHSRVFGSSSPQKVSSSPQRLFSSPQKVSWSPQRPFLSPQKASSSPHKANTSAARSGTLHTPFKPTGRPKFPDSPPSPSPDEISVARRRPRAQTADLQVPQPEAHPSMYTDERVGKCIEYVNHRLGSKMRTPSPIQEKALLVHKGACQDYLDARKEILPEGRKKEMLSEIRQYEIDISDSGWVKAVGSEDRHIFQGQLLYLRRLHYYARYGDYAGRLSHLVRQGAIDHKVKGWELLSGAQQWTKISERIQNEVGEWAKRAKTKNREAHPTTSAVMEACMAIGTDFSRMFQAIHTYAARNDNLHNPVNNLIAAGNFPEIANTIYADLAELGNIMPVEMCEEEQFMRAVLLELRDAWFEIEEGDDYETMPFTWIPTQALISDWKALKNAAVKKKADQAVQAQAIANGAKKRLDALSDEDQLSDSCQSQQLQTHYPRPGQSTRGKHLESYLLPPQREKEPGKRFKKREGRQSTLLNLH